MEFTVEGLASSLVREFLNKKKCMKTLQLLDTEWPRNENSVSSRSKLAQALKIETWVDKNKSSSSPLKTLLEVIISSIQQLNVSQMSPSDDTILRRIQYSTLDKHMPKQAQKFPRPFTADSGNVHKAIEKKTLRNDNLSLTVETLDEVDIDELITKKPMISKQPGTKNDWSFDNPREKRSNVNKMDKSPIFDHKERKNLNFASKKSSDQKSKDFLLDIIDDTTQKEPCQPYQLTAEKFVGSNSQQRYYFANHLGSHVTKFEAEVGVGAAFSYEIAKELRNLIFGSTKYAFLTEWCEQNFSFSGSFDRPEELRFGIVQKKGGPCGILASVQALVLKYILFSIDDVKPTESFLNVRDSQRTACLVQAITEIVWRAGEFKQATLAVMAQRKQIHSLPHEYRCDGVTEYVVTNHFISKSELQSAVKQHINIFENGKGSCILLLYSAILSRGLNNVKKDMDEPSGKLMGAHNYCTQEMVNLLLVGRATSNAFNDSLQLDEMTLLKGIHTQSEVGLLSLFEHYDSCKIGDYYKTPKYPIWLVCSESHFTVLFGLKPNLTSKFSSPSTFTLYYYDGLASQDEVIQLTVDTTAEVDDSVLKNDLTPPLEHCIRTKWSRAYIDWNETEPLL